MPESVKPKPRTFWKKFIKVALITFCVLAALIITVIIASSIFVATQVPVFVNKDVALNNKLNIPELLQPSLQNGEKVFNLTVQPGAANFLDGEPTKTFGYNGVYLGPTIRAHRGDKIHINVTNNLSDPTTAHWHGMELPAAMDGAAHQRINPGENWQPHWTVTNQAASLWYHPHLLGKTGEQVYRGLGGMFIIDDDNSDQLDLPKNYGADDIPLIVQDREFDNNNQLVYDGERTDLLGHTGMFGNKILVNGTYAPYMDVPAKLVRLRVLNASNARHYDFGFENGRSFYQIATDGGLLEAPVTRNHMVLAPAERAEIVVDLSKDTKPITLMSYAVHEENSVLRFMRTILGAQRDENQQYKILELRPQPTNDQVRPLPAKLNTIERIDPSQAVTTRKLLLDPGSQTINGKQMDHSRIDQLVYAGDTEIWEIQNLSGVFHPIHIHGVQFQILDRGGRPPADYEQGWKDTVRVSNGETVRVIMRMPEYADPHLPYMFHCHILEHEDMGMMGQYIVVTKDTKPQDIYVESQVTKDSMPNMHQMHAQ